VGGAYGGRRLLSQATFMFTGGSPITLANQMNLIFEQSKQMRWQTDMRHVFSALPDVCESYDWLISDIDCNWFPDERIAYGKDPILLSGSELNEIINKHDIQFIWAVFSAIPKGIKPNLSNIPYADDNPQLWKGTPKPQLPEAEFEIICWDSTSTLLIGVSDELAAQFKATFTDTINLNEITKKPTSKLSLP
jgi:hypothetical protein